MILVSSTKEGAEKKWDKLKTFCRATGLEISNDGKEKTAYTTNSVHNKAKLQDNAGKDIPTLEPEESYKYLGVHINLDLDWTKQTEVRNKTNPPNKLLASQSIHITANY